MTKIATKLFHWCKSQWIRLRLAMLLSNWREVWPLYFSGKRLPPLRLRNGMTFHHGPNDGPVFLLFEVFSDGCYRKYCRSQLEGVLVDIGANIGSVILDWAGRSPQLRIHAYEPNPESFKTLRHNVDSNGLSDRVTLFSEAVGSATGRFRLDVSSPSLIASGYSSAFAQATGEGISAPMVDLDEVIRRTNAQEIALLKIDAEGAETDILTNASVATLKVIRRIYLEYHDHLVPDSLLHCLRKLEEGGFRCRVKKVDPWTGMLYGIRD